MVDTTQVNWNYVAGAVLMLLEWWLGKTDKVKAGSTVELILNGAKVVLGTVIQKKTEK